MTRTFIILIFIATLISCGNSKTKKRMERKFDHLTVQGNDFDRYILVKGKNFKNSKNIVFEWAEIFSAGEKIDFKYGQTALGNWTILEIPNDSLFDHYNFHNLVYWFLGTPPDDNNYADFSIGLSIDKQDEKTYLIYNDYNLRESIATNDDVFGIFQNDEKFILSIPFDKFKKTENDKIPDFNKFINENNIDLTKIRLKELNFIETIIEVEEQ